MPQHYRLFEDTKQLYGRIFAEARQELASWLSRLRDEYHCEQCDTSGDADFSAWLTRLHAGCGYRPWQQAALYGIENELGLSILQRLQQVEAYKNTFSCHMCGMCCRLASSEHDYETLQRRAADGDEFARQFSGIFLPYASREAARGKFPEVVAAVLAESGQDESDGAERVFFYHCPHVQEDNRCGLYGSSKRPAICASYPETPLSFVYEKCAWRPWQEETHSETLKVHAMLALCTDAADKLKRALA